MYVALRFGKVQWNSLYVNHVVVILFWRTKQSSSKHVLGFIYFNKDLCEHFQYSFKTLIRFPQLVNQSWESF